MASYLKSKKSSKSLPGQLLNMVKHDTGSTIGSNLRNILLLTEKNWIEDPKDDDIYNLIYASVETEDYWKIGMAREIIK